MAHSFQSRPFESCLAHLTEMRQFGGENLEDVELVGTSTQICVRETRRLKGVYILTEEDAAKGNTFEDTIGWRSGYLDLMG